MLETTVVVIGGGATGMGTLRDLCMRGVPAVLLEQGGLAHGTSSRFLVWHCAHNRTDEG